MRKVAFFVGGTVVALGVAGVAAFRKPPSVPQASAADSTTAPRLEAGDTAGLPGPRQPVFFRHDIHAGQYKIECQYCHYTAAVSSEPGIPSMQTCMGCHLVIAGSDSGSRAEIKKVRDAANGGQPIVWQRIHALARHVHFPHARHIQALGPTACFTCHGDVQRMPQVYKVNNIQNMGWCITCHLQRNVTRDCSVCHY